MSGVARRADTVLATDTHVVNGATVKLPFVGPLTVGLVESVLVNGRAIAVDGSIALNMPPPHPGSNQGRVVAARNVTAGGRPVACVGDKAITCNQPVDLPVGTVSTGSTDVTVG